MTITLRNAFIKNFLGKAPNWYKSAIILFLIINPILFANDPFIAGWLLVIEFIFTLAMALKCYPLQPGGLLAIEAVAIGMTDAGTVKNELVANFEVLLLLIFMVAGIYFMKQLLLFIFTKILLGIRSKELLALAFCSMSAFLSAFLDALTVIAVVISVAVGFYSIYHRVASCNTISDDNMLDDNLHDELNRDDLEQYRSFLRSLMMHAGVGTALGGVITMVGEPQNLIIAKTVNWEFAEFFIRMLPVGLPVLICSLATCVLVEKFCLFDYGSKLPETVRQILFEFNTSECAKRTNYDVAKLIVQALIAIWLILALALHLAAVGLIGLTVIILVTSFTGVVDEHKIGKAFQEALPFTALLVVFFAIVAVIIDQQLFTPVINAALKLGGGSQLTMFYIANGLLSMVSDNVFVGSIYIHEVKDALTDGLISLEQFELLAVAINTGTNLPSVATPNGQAAFLFLLTSTLAPLLRLSYGKMVYMALPYTIVMGLIGLVSIEFLLIPMNDVFYNMGWLTLVDVVILDTIT
ncbi:Na(+)/H(+) antiporter NhaB [Candidatus Enterovibrio escicola]|uniref:Na(+)/H(+) antiporter NhaB n=1 Tax=Candidatus Enterovibrio escicola TaxID=1927127 RepID=A0A2A5T410_9GAMM|nr:Na(+)/H(+) antiporter NhaB [Candidatus Enterovibrio escacola]PCS22858.1 Na+/H+ antiporter NhaB [Candidatus Enterovibrio escacola]